MKASIITTVLPSPGEGQSLVWVPSSTDLVKILGITTTLATGASGSTRRIYMQLSDQNGLVYAALPCSGGQGESLEHTYSWVRGASAVLGPENEGGSRSSVDMPEIWLMPGDQVTIKTFATPGDDKIGQTVARYLVRHIRQDQQFEEQLEETLGL